MNNYLSEPNWRTRKQWPQRQIPAVIANWLFDASSLTLRLQQRCNKGFRVQVFKQSWQQPMHNEARHLGLRDGQYALVRQVHLFCNDQPVVYARTVIPRRSLQGKPRRLASLGQQSLGAVLFADKTMQRSEIEVCKLSKRQSLYAQALSVNKPEGEAEALTAALPVDEIWARRSIFTLQQRPLLVSEIFLPAIAYT